MEKRQREFHAQEYECLRREIEMHIADRRKVETQHTIAATVIYAWLISEQSTLAPFLLNFVIFLPFVILLLGYFKWEALMLRTIQIGQYLATLEEKLAADGTGWEAYLKTEREDKTIKGQLEGQGVRFIWLFLTILSCVFSTTVAFGGGWYEANPPPPPTAPSPQSLR